MSLRAVWGAWYGTALACARHICQRCAVLRKERQGCARGTEGGGAGGIGAGGERAAPLGPPLSPS
eukprot:2093081-Rhodomonas_salina.1